MSAKSIEAGRAFLKLTVDDKEFAKGLTGSIAKLDSFGRKLQSVSLKIGAAGTAITAPLGAAVAKFTQMGSALNDMSKRTGASVESLSELQFAAEQTGTDMSAVEGAFKKMARTIGAAERGVKTSAEAFEELGLSADVLARKRPDEQFNDIARAIRGISDPTRRADLAMRVLGRAGTQLLPLIEELDNLRKAARESGGVITTEMAKAADDLGDSFDKIKFSAGAAVAQVGAALAPAILKASEAINKSLPGLVEWVKQNNEVILVVGASGLALQALAVAIGAVGTAFRTAAAAAVAFKKAVALAALVPPQVTAAAGVSIAGGAVIGNLVGNEGRTREQRIADLPQDIARAKANIAEFSGSSNEMERNMAASAAAMLAGYEQLQKQQLDELRQINKKTGKGGGIPVGNR